MALDEETLRVLGELGYNWAITDDVPWVYAKGEVPSRWIPSVGGTAVFLRSNFWSNRISFHGHDGGEMAERMVQDLFQWTGKDDSYVILAMDGEPSVITGRKPLIPSFCPSWRRSQYLMEYGYPPWTGY